MAVNIKFGNQLFQTQRRIAELEQENRQLSDKVAFLESLNLQLKQEKNQADKEAFEVRNSKSLQEIEFESMRAQHTRLCEELAKSRQQCQTQQQEVQKLSTKIKQYQIELDGSAQEVAESTNLEQKLRAEVSATENRSERLEKRNEELLAVLAKKNESIALLEKSLAQKDKHIAVLLREKERLHSSQQVQSSAAKAHKENTFVLPENASTVAKQAIPYATGKLNETNKQGELLKELENRDAEIRRLKQQNTDLITRLRSKK